MDIMLIASLMSGLNDCSLQQEYAILEYMALS